MSEWQAVVCKRVIQGDQGSGTQWFVRAPDAYLLECGNDEERAQRVANSINDARVSWPKTDPF